MSRFFAILAIAVALLAINVDAQCVNMPNAYKYSVLATTTVTNSGASRFTGWFGIGSGSYTGLTAENVDTRVPEGLQLGTSSNPALTTALNEMQSTYNSIAALTFTELTTSTVGASTELGARTLAPGNYRVSGNAILNGQLRLTTSGSYNFYIVGTLNVAAGATVTQDQSLSNACVTWAVQEQVNINNNAQVFGFIISRNTISLSPGTIVTGGVASYTEVSAQTATVTNSGVNCCSGGSQPTTVFAWVLTSVNQCSTFGQTALCNTAGTSTANYQCASASSSNLFYTVQGSNSNCLGSSLSVICLSQGTSGTQVACSLPQVISGSPNTVISPVVGVPTQSFGCYTACQSATVSYAWVFNGFSQCTQACGTSATVQGTFSCYSTTSQSGGVYSLSTSASCTNAGAQLNVICLASSGSGLSVGCSTVYGTDANLLPQFVQAFATPSASKTCPVVTCPEQTNNNPGSWCIGEFGACSATCGANGVQTRQVTCVSPTDGSPLADSQCLVDGTQPKPVSVQQCNTNVVCPCHTWIVSSWGGCSGCRGTQTRTVTCVLISDTSVIIPDNQCQAIMSRPASTQTCNSQDTSCIRYQWVYGNYGACFPSCGSQRTQTRSRTCYGSTNPLTPSITLNPTTGLPNNDAFAFVARDADCAGLADAGTTLTCPVISCGTVSYSWAADNVWSGCSINNCGGGIETRRAWCVSSATSAIAEDALCTGVKPATSRACNTNPCPAYHYVAGSWSACSASCGKGYRQRSVACYAGAYTTAGQLNNNIDMTQPVAMSFCQNQPVPVPVTFEECTAGTACSVAYNWFAGAWSGCSLSCGGGVQTRSVTCWSAEFDQRDPVNEALCIAAQRPASQQSCNTASCQQYVWDNPAWGVCSCETRQQTRTPRCYPRLPNGQPNTAVSAVADSFCAGQTDPVNPNLPCPWALAKPVSQQNCVPSGCTDYYWWAGTWGSCLNANNQETFCGGGTRSRAVLCYSYADDLPVASSFCTGAQPTYAATEPCNTQACTFFQWKESPWCSCTKQCGGGVRTKSVQCYAQPENVPVPDSYCATANPPLSSFVLSEACNTAPCTSYVWMSTSWTTCNKDCGCGRQTRSVYCVPSNNQVVSAAVSDDKCQFVLGGKPASYAACNTTPCPPVYFWAVTPWQSCSASCGTTGIQQRAVNCYWSDLPDTTCQTNRWLVNPTSPLYANCPSPPPRSTRPCNRQVCVSYAWYWSEWSQCSVTCGGGTRTRNVACYASNDSSNYVADSLCPNGLGQRPSYSESCNTQACDNYIWIAEPWLTCSATCGGGVSTRTVQCYAASDKTVPVSDAFCNPVAAGLVATTGSRTPKPATTMVCNSCACAPSYQYYYDQWSQCSATCGGGTQTRFAGCFASDNPNQILQDTACVGLTKAATTQSCNTQPCQTYYWGTGQWSACPAVCPTSVGTQTRTVQCFGTASSTALTDEAPCLASAGVKPATTQTCSTECRSCAWQYTTASLCSKNCNGVMYRKAQCICSGSDSTPQDASLCSGQQQDSTQMAAIPCNVNPVADCANTNYQWFTGNPGACSATCGTGTSCRVVYCYNTFDLTMSPVADSFCSHLIGGKPVEQQACQLTACPVYDWQLLPGSCPVTCGGGYTVNTVQCRVVLGNGLYGNVVSEANCNAATKPVTSSICNTIPCSYISSFQWVIGTPGTCSKTCGEGIAYREIRCIDTLTSLRAQDSSCIAALGAGSKPSDSIACNVGQSTINCPNNYCLSTRDNIWSCFATDRNLQVESSFCQWATGFTVPTSGSSSSTSSWMVGPWSSCAGGSRSRSVTCWSSTPLTTGGSGFTYQSSNCNESLRPSTTGSC